ncbi:MAG: CBS domain-containing protein [Bdellovibrionales bacterium]|nr:CBS domain-containing protein [Bdellovibrionales bacterium]
MTNLSDITVEEFTSLAPISIEKKADMDQALELMQENKIRHLPVIENQKVVGIISERDVLTHIGKDWGKMLTVEDVMNTSLLSVYANDNLGEVAYQLSAQKKGSAIVLDTEGNLYGIFTTTDALNALVEILYPMAYGQSDLNHTIL